MDHQHIIKDWLSAAFEYLYKRTIVAVICFVASVSLIAQDSLLLTDSFRFENGLYTSFERLRTNQPDIPLDRLKMDYFQSARNATLQISALKNKEGETISDSTAWCMVVKGKPFVRLNNQDKENVWTVFAEIQVMGHLCYYAFEQYEQVKLRMPVYNPATGRPYMEGQVTRKQLTIRERMLRFEDGAEVEFNEENLRKWISDDRELIRALDATDPEEREERLFNCLLVYNQRHPVKIKKAS